MREHHLGLLGLAKQPGTHCGCLECVTQAAEGAPKIPRESAFSLETPAPPLPSFSPPIHHTDPPLKLKNLSLSP